MKKLLFIFLVLISCSRTKEQSYIEEIENNRYRLNVEFSNIKTSPLTSQDFKGFKQLPFYPIDTNFRIAAKLKRTPDEPIFEMQTTTERKPLYSQFGIASFSLNNSEYTLTIYQSQELVSNPDFKNHLFIPFTDLTNGEESYEGGRYIDIEALSEDTMVIDFNKAYNPYCAYNEKYSCPIPPVENNLEVKINAGIKLLKSL